MGGLALLVASFSGGRPLPLPASAPPPTLLRPFQGEATGSVWAARALRPTFRWTSVAGAEAYEVEIDDSCEGALGCDFPSPELRQRVALTSLRPAVALDVSRVAPVGARFFWRVRACAGTVCTAWSSIRYVDVGRQRQDFNGDGYGDLVVNGGPGVMVFLGGPTLDATADWTLAPSASEVGIGGQVTWVGDMNGDGFGDLAFTAAEAATAPAGRSIRIYGGAAVPPTSPPLATITANSTDTFDSIHRGGDIDGDGNADLIARGSTSGTPGSVVFLMFGDRSGVAAGVLKVPVNAGSVSGGCDFDSDGDDDVAAGGDDGALLLLTGHARGDADDPYRFGSSPVATGAWPLGCWGDVDGSGRAAALVARTNPAAQDPSLRLRIFQPRGPCNERQLPSPTAGAVGVVAGASFADTNGDGIHDLVLGDPRSNRAFVVTSGADCPPTTVDVFEHRADGLGTSNTGTAVASPGDMDGDGFDEIAIGNPISGIDSIVRGEIYLFRGRPAGTPPPAAPDVTITGAGSFAYWLD